VVSPEREALYLEFQPLVRRLIRQYGDTPECREDLAGEIYFRYCAIVDAYDPSRGIPLKPYIVRQLTASVYTYARHGWMRRRREVSYEEKAAVSEPVKPEDPTPAWDDKLSTESIIKTLPQAIGKLPNRQRKVLIWRYYDQKSFEEIAEQLDIQVATARSLLRHAINGLRKHMARTIAEHSPS
jgi:RNA polymerase sigma factor (sigma-70 family)